MTNIFLFSTFMVVIHECELRTLYFEESNMNKCHLAKLSWATLLAPASAPVPSTFEMPVSALVVAKTKEFFLKLKKAEKYYFETIIETMNCDFTYADKKVWWSIH